MACATDARAASSVPQTSSDCQHDDQCRTAPAAQKPEESP